MKREVKEAVRTVPFEIDSVDGDWKETTKRWHELSDQCKQMANCLWQTWLVWHVENGSADTLRAWLNKRADEGKQAAGKCPVEAVPNELSKRIYKELSTRFASLHLRVVVLLMNVLIRDIKTHKAANGSLPGWSAILLCHQSHQAFTHPYPILFDKRNARIHYTGEKDKPFVMDLTFQRMPVEGRKTCVSITDRVTLRCRGRSVQSQVEILKRIESGEYKFRGSKLRYHKPKRKWFVDLCYQMPKGEGADIDPDKTAFLFPSRNRPWNLRLPGRWRKEWVGGRGHYVTSTRRSVTLTRASRAEYYKHASSNMKGHGRKRASDWRDRYQRVWRNFTKSVNHYSAKQAVDWCILNKCGRLVYFQPVGKFAESRFLATAGKDGRRNDGTTWEWFQIGAFLQQKCQQAGIECVIKKVGYESPTKTGKEKKPKSKRAGDKACKRVTKKQVNATGK